MREIGPHKLKSFITPPDYDDAIHWLSALNWSDALKDYLEAEQVAKPYVGELEKMNKRRKLSVIDGGKVTRNGEKNNQ